MVTKVLAMHICSSLCTSAEERQWSGKVRTGGGGGQNLPQLGAFG